MIIKLLGKEGCPSCKRLDENTRAALKDLGQEAEIMKVVDIDEIIRYGVMSVPAMVIDEKVAFQGAVPGVADLKKIISER